MPAVAACEMACEMPVPGQQVGDIMPGDDTDSEECEHGKRKANTGESKGGKVVKDGKSGRRGHIIYPVV